MTYEVVNTTNDVIVKQTENQAEAQDYYEQCVRGSDRYHERNPQAQYIEFILREVS